MCYGGDEGCVHDLDRIITFEAVTASACQTPGQLDNQAYRAVQSSNQRSIAIELKENYWTTQLSEKLPPSPFITCANIKYRPKSCYKLKSAFRFLAH